MMFNNEINYILPEDNQYSKSCVRIWELIVKNMLKMLCNDSFILSEVTISVHIQNANMVHIVN